MTAALAFLVPHAVFDQQQIQAAKQRRSCHCCRCDVLFGNAAPCAQALEHPRNEGGTDAIEALQVALDGAFFEIYPSLRCFAFAS